MMEEKWQMVVEQAICALSQACETAAEAIARGEAGVKDIRELTTALKELNALHRSLGDEDDGEVESPTVEVSFDGDGEGWSR